MKASGVGDASEPSSWGEVEGSPQNNGCKTVNPLQHRFLAAPRMVHDSVTQVANVDGQLCVQRRRYC